MYSSEKLNVGAAKPSKEAFLPHQDGSRINADGIYRDSYAYCLNQLVGSELKSHVLVIPAFVKVISAVETLHRAGLRKCNLDPRKIIVHGSGKVDLNTQEERFGETALGLASFKYAAPELSGHTAEAAVTVAADVYALGFMFYEILLGRNLFQRQFAEVGRRGELGWMSWHADKSKRAELLHTLLGVFPLSLSRLVDGMIEKDVEKRSTELAGIAESFAGSCRATATISGLSALRGEMQKPGMLAKAVSGPALTSWSKWATTLRNKARKGLSRRRSAAA